MHSYCVSAKNSSRLVGVLTQGAVFWGTVSAEQVSKGGFSSSVVVLSQSLSWLVTRGAVRGAGEEKAPTAALRGQ